MLANLPLLLIAAFAATNAVSAQNINTGLNFQPCPALNAKITRVNGVEGTLFECAKLSVPLDYTAANSKSLELDLFRVNATKEPVLGTVLINFGGPGGTGAENLPVLADQARNVIGPQWHLVSWDPRGTGNTIPFQCDLTASVGSTVPPQRREVGTIVSTNTTHVFLNGGWKLAGQIADICYSQSKDTDSLIGTAFVARDMVEIVNALGEDGMLRYYGWSYGTALGSYFAAMFPELVDRMVLDANVNPHDYQSGTYGVTPIDDDKAFAGFINACYNVTDDCALYTLLNPKEPQDILDAINTALRPLARNATMGIEAYSNYLAIKSTFVMPLYFPNTWPDFATTIADLLNGTTAPTTQVETYGSAEQAQIGIRASDAIFIANSTQDYVPVVEDQAAVSPGFSDIVYSPIWISAQWKTPAKERYWGDFNVTTKSPILYVNGEYDPATPLVNAYKASQTFAGSVVLPHSGYGHGVFVSPSECVAGYVRAYFADALMPPKGTHCEPDQSLVEIWRTATSTSGGAFDSNNNSSTTTSPGGAAATNVAAHADPKLLMAVLGTVVAVASFV